MNKIDRNKKSGGARKNALLDFCREFFKGLFNVPVKGSAKGSVNVSAKGPTKGFFSQGKEKKKHQGKKHQTKRFLVFARILAFFFLFVCLCFFLAYLLPWKALDTFSHRQYSTRFYDRRGDLLYILPLEEGLHREWLDLEAIPKHLVEAFIEAEDKNFWHHHGVDFKAIFRAAGQNLKTKKRVSGASTISMQLARLIVPRKNPRASFGDKFFEMLRAIRLELKRTKTEILELYLNGIPFGFQCEGLQSAAKFFYGKEVYDLRADEIAELVLIPRNPNLYAPTREKQYRYPNEAPHFLQYLISQESRFPPELFVSIDKNLNDIAQNLLLQSIQDYDYARISNGAVFAIDNRTGEILVWLGNKDWYNSFDGQVDGVLTRNQAGSTMKAFLYALALERGFSPATVLPDVPMDFGGEEVYVPQNFNNRFNGPQLFRTSLASSLNIPAVYLLWRLGIDDYVEKLLDLGFESLRDVRGSQGLSMALGSAEVSLFELVRAFSVFANEGELIKPRAYMLENREEKNNKAKKSEVKKLEKKVAVFSSDTANIIADMLSDKEARSLGFGFPKVFDTPYPAIFKTGTSNQFQNILALGATPAFTVGAWMGNLSGETVLGETGSSIPAKIVRSLLDILEEERLTKGGEEMAFNEPLHFQKKYLCALSGMSPSPYCKNLVEEFCLSGDESSESCSWHYLNLASNSIAIRYPDEFQRWFASPNLQGSLFSSSALRFLYPLDRARFILDRGMSESSQSIKVEVAGGGEDEASLFVNGVFISKKERPFVWYLPLREGQNILEVSCGFENAEISIDVR